MGKLSMDLCNGILMEYKWNMNGITINGTKYQWD